MHKCLNDNEQVTVTESEEKNEKLRLPAVTVCSFPAWVNTSGLEQSTHPIGNYKWKCPNGTTAEDFSTCIRKKTFDFNDLVKSAPRVSENAELTHSKNIATGETS